MIIKELPKEERPRERLLKYGSESLSDAELLSIILKTGTKDKNVKDLALEILNNTPLYDFKDIKKEQLIKIKGIKEIKALEILAVIELGKRIFICNSECLRERYLNALDIYKNNKYLFVNKKQEYFYCLYLNNKQELIERKLLFMGTINKSVVHPREIFKEAYLLSATSIVCMHNHPSGHATPSFEDIELTKSLKEIGRLQGIPIVDHIIFGESEYYSFYEEYTKQI